MGSGQSAVLRADAMIGYGGMLFDMVGGVGGLLV